MGTKLSVNNYVLIHRKFEQSCTSDQLLICKYVRTWAEFIVGTPLFVSVQYESI